MNRNDMNEKPALSKTSVSKSFFSYGGMKNNQKTKVHISDDDGNVLCGVKSFLMQQYGKLDSNGMIPELNHINTNHKEQNTCKKCLIKFNLCTSQNVC